jgi:hypothetical protein
VRCGQPHSLFIYSIFPKCINAGVQCNGSCLSATANLLTVPYFKHSFSLSLPYVNSVCNVDLLAHTVVYCLLYVLLCWSSFLPGEPA